MRKWAGVGKEKNMAATWMGSEEVAVLTTFGNVYKLPGKRGPPVLKIMQRLTVGPTPQLETGPNGGGLSAVVSCLRSMTRFASAAAPEFDWLYQLCPLTTLPERDGLVACYHVSRHAMSCPCLPLRQAESVLSMPHLSVAKL